MKLWFFSLLPLSVLLADAPSAPQDSSLPIGGDAAIALEYFRSLPDGSWQGNSGAFASTNLALCIQEHYGMGVQVGGSYGLYDWDGRGSNLPGNTKALQQQGFVSAGFFRMTPHASGWNGGALYDVMFNKSMGVFALHPTVSQVRGQVGYLFQGGNEFGAWGTINAHTSHQESQEMPVTFRAIPQVNLFWSHCFHNGAHTTLWAGTPYRRGLMYASGRAGNYLFGANFRAPLTKTLSLIGHALYMGARSAPGNIESKNYAANVCFGLNYAFGGCKAGQRPYLALADNSNCILDTSLNN